METQLPIELSLPLFQYFIKLVRERAITNDDHILKRHRLCHHRLNGEIEIFGFVFHIYRHEHGIWGQVQTTHRAPSPLIMVRTVFQMMLQSIRSERCSM